MVARGGRYESYGRVASTVTRKSLISKVYIITIDESFVD